MSSYQYDVFFSYKRDEQSNDWHKEVALKIGFWLRKELNKANVNIFIDTEDINTGEKWKKKIADSLKRSKCLVAIWSPDYFHSPWCLSEWKSFLERETMLEKQGVNNKGLIIPAIYHDGDHFPQEAKDTQAVDFSDYNSTMAFFWKSEDGYKFEKEKLKDFAKDIARKVRAAPDYNDDFPIVILDYSKVSLRESIKRIGQENQEDND